MRHRAVLFDLDGTLSDHFPAIRRCHAYAAPAGLQSGNGWWDRLCPVALSTGSGLLP